MKPVIQNMLRGLRMSNSILLGWTVLGVMAINSVWYGYFREAWLSPDAVCYLRMARNLMAGHGMNPGGLAGSVQGWFAVWPIGYPVFVAILSALLHVEVTLASKLGAVLITGLTLLTFRRWFPTVFPLLTLGLVNFAYLKIFRSTWSEQPFLLCLLLFACLLADFFSHERPSWRVSFALFLVSIGLFFFRYIGIFSLGVLLAFSCYRFAVNRQRSVGKQGANWRSYSLVAGIAGLSVGLMGTYLVLNDFNAGSITGMSRPLSSESLGRFIRTSTCAAVRETQAVFFLIALAGLVVVPLLKMRGGLKTLVRSSERHQILCESCAATGVGYLSCILLARYLFCFDDFGYRLLYPGTLMLIIAGVVKLADLSGIDFRQTFDRLPRNYILVYLLSVLVLGSQVLNIETVLRRLTGVPRIAGMQSFAKVKEATIKKFAEIPSGSLVFVEGYSSDDYLAGYIRPDLFVVPHRFGAYGEQIRGFKEGVKVYVEQKVPRNFDETVAGLEGVQEIGSPFRFLLKDANHIAISIQKRDKMP